MGVGVLQGDAKVSDVYEKLYLKSSNLSHVNDLLNEFYRYWSNNERDTGYICEHKKYFGNIVTVIQSVLNLDYFYIYLRTFFPGIWNVIQNFKKRIWDTRDPIWGP